MDFDKLSERVKKISKDTMTEVRKMNEVRQLNTKVSEEKRLLNRLYLELGQKFFAKYKDAEMMPEGFEDDFHRIEERYSVMDLLQDQIRSVKGVVLCPCCNMEVAVTERYCSNCGQKMPEVVKIEDKIEDSDAIIIDSQVVEPETPEEGTDEKKGLDEMEAEPAEAAAEVIKSAEEAVAEAEEAAAEVMEAAGEAATEVSEAAEEVVAEPAEAEAAEKVAAEAEEAVEEEVAEAAEAAEEVVDEVKEAVPGAKEEE